MTAVTTPAAGIGRDTRGAGDQDGRLLLDAVRFVERAVIASDGEGRQPVGLGGPGPLQGEKVRCEAAMLLRAAWPVADRSLGLTEALATLADELGAIKVDELAVRLCLHPGVALDLALVPLHLRCLGLGRVQLEPLLADLFGSDRLRGPERPANRELEQLWLHGLWSGDVKSGDVESGDVEPGGVARVLAGSSLAREFDHLAGSTDDAYAFTHSILYATDHGRRGVALPRSVDEIVEDAEAILAVALGAGNHDVAAEVLWTWPMLDVHWTPLAAEARAFLAEVAETCGFLPGPGFDQAVNESLPVAERQLYELRTSYHTTLAHGLLLAATMSREGRRPSPGRGGVAAAPTGPVAAAAMAALLPPRTRASAWWNWVSMLPSARAGALASALVTMALRRAVDAADLAGVDQALTLAEDHGLPESPALRQARVLLRRAVACAELTGAAAAGLTTARG